MFIRLGHTWTPTRIHGAMELT